MKKSLNNEQGSILVICIFFTMVLTIAGMFALSLTSFELETAGNAKRSKVDFQNAERGMLFAMANFNQIFVNSDGTNTLYSGGDAGIYGDGVVGTDGNPALGLTSLRDMAPGVPNPGFVMFDYVAAPAPTVAVPAPVARLVARVEIKSILKAPYNIIGSGLTGTFSTGADIVPLRPHIGPRPDGYDKRYRSRRFAITSTAYDSNGNLTQVQIQSGVTKPVLKSTIQQYMSL